MHPARHQVVARAFRRGLSQNWCFDFQKAQAIEVPPRYLHEAMSQNDVALKLGPPEIQDTMPEAKLLRRQLLLFLSGDRDSRSQSWPDDFQIGHVDLDLARGEVRIT